jgi:alpha-L-fucosidase 2
MLLQSHLRDENGDFYQDLLPALPSKLTDGKISGLKGRGGFELDITWENKKLLAVKVKSLLGNKLNLRYNGKIHFQRNHSRRNLFAWAERFSLNF